MNKYRLCVFPCLVTLLLLSSPVQAQFSFGWFWSNWNTFWYNWNNFWDGLLCLLGFGCSDCTIFPTDNIWNTPIDTAPIHERSDAYVASIGLTTKLHPDFGSGGIGIPFVEVEAGQELVDIVYTDSGDESDAGPFPIPEDAPIEGGPGGDGDRHVIVVDLDQCSLYELYRAFPREGSDGSWAAASGAMYDLRSNALRPNGWTSADAAGLAIFPGLVRYEEAVQEGAIEHAIRFTAGLTQGAYVWPARHQASDITNPNVPPMGQRFRLNADYDISTFSPVVRVVLTAFKRYGIILADHGSDWYITGAPDDRWNNDVLREIKNIPGSAFEAVDVSGLVIDPDSAQAQQS